MLFEMSCWEIGQRGCAWLAVFTFTQESAQATGELKLGGRYDPPEFIDVFEAQTVKPGPFVSLKCVAKGDPAPQIDWFVYDKRIDGSEGDSAIRYFDLL